MKKYITLALLFTSLSIASAQSMVNEPQNTTPVGDVEDNTMQCTDLKNTLKLRSKDANTSNEVTALQEFLQDAGLLDVDPSGYFGATTQKAVKRFQKQNGLLASGLVGSYTRKAIKEKSCVQDTTSTWSKKCTTNPSDPSCNTLYSCNGVVSHEQCPTSNEICNSEQYRDANGVCKEQTYTCPDGTVISAFSTGCPTKTKVQELCHSEQYRDVSGACKDITMTCPDGRIVVGLVSCGTGSSDTPTRTLNMTYNGTSLPPVTGITKSAAQEFCSFSRSVSCTWDGQSIEKSGSKGASYNISFVKPVAGHNETISTNGGLFAFTITDTTQGMPTNISGMYRVYLAKYSDYNSNSGPESITEATIRRAERSNGMIYLKSDLSGVLPGRYYVSVANIKTGEWTNISAYTYFVAKTMETDMTPEGGVGKYVGYMNGQMFITTESISKQDAYNNCKLNYASNPGKSMRCTWNDKEIYSSSPSTSSDSSTVQPTTPSSKAAPSGIISPDGGGNSYLVPHGSQVLGASSMCTTISRNIHRGDESADTVALQSFLKSGGFLADDVTGFYGDKTVEAVKAFQRSQDLPESGMVYDITRRMITRESCGE